MSIVFDWKAFSELSLESLYQILQLRETVFQIEQKCSLPDIEGDISSWHVLANVNNNFAGYSRVCVLLDQVKIQRVVVKKSFRGKRLGVAMLRYVLASIEKKFPGLDIIISAQFGLLAYYQALGFTAVGNPYDEAGIEHIRMVKYSFNPA